MRRTATVTISAPDSRCAPFINGSDAYLPVPMMSRDVNTRPPRTNGSEAALTGVSGATVVLTLRSCRVGPETSRKEHVVDEPPTSDADRRGDRRARESPIDRPHGLGVDDAHVLDPNAGRRELAADLRRELFRVMLASRGRVPPFEEDARDRGGEPAFLRREVRVARGHREAVGLADRVADHESDRKVEVPDHPSHDRDLLEVFAAEDGDVGSDLVKELGDDRRHPAEVTGSRAPLAVFRHTAHVDGGREPGRVELAGLRQVHEVHPYARELRPV